MKNRLLSVIYLGAVCLLTAACSKQAPFAPDRLFLTNDGTALLVANRSTSELLRVKPDMQTVEQRLVLDAPVNDLLHDKENHLWVVCDGEKGKLYELNATNLSVLSQMEMGYSPSALCYNDRTQSLWVTQRHEGELWEVNASTQQVLAKIPVGREPSDIISFAEDSLLLVTANLPEMAADAFPIAAQLSIVDALGKGVIKRIMLPNGSTDVKAVTMDRDKKYAYVTHLLGRYQLPTNQVDRGWMSTNALSVVNLQTCELENTVLLDTPQKGAANPWGVTVSADNAYILVAASGAHELVCIDRVALHSRLEQAKKGEMVTPSTRGWEDIPNDAGFLYGIRSFISTGGKGPRSVVATKEMAYTANYFTGELVGVNLATGEQSVHPVEGTALVATPAGKGEMYFHDASICFQQWQSCASCHPNDARMDGLNWDLMNDGMGNPKNTKTLVLAHQTPPCMITGIRKDAETAVRSGIKYIQFAQVDESVSEAIDTYLKSLKPLPSPHLVDGNLSDAAKRGKVSFDAHCASCHSGAYYTDLKQYNVPWTVGAEKDRALDVPALSEAWRTAPYLYDGQSYSMTEMLKIHGPQTALADNELTDLAEYVLSL